MIGLFARVQLGSIFIFAGAAKFVRPRSAASALSAALPIGPVRATSIYWIRAVALLELALGSGLILAEEHLLSFAAVAVGLCTLFLVFHVVLSRQGYDVSCGCFGERQALPKVRGLEVSRNVLLVGLSLSLLFCMADSCSPPHIEDSLRVLGAVGFLVTCVCASWVLLRNVALVARESL